MKLAIQSPVKNVSVSATVIRADGRREERGVIAFWHRNPLKMLAWRYRWLLAWFAVLAALWLVGAQHEVVGVVALATVFTHAGKAIVTNRIKGSGTEPSYVAWGTGAGTAAVGDTTLFTEASETRVAGTSSRVTTTETNDTYQVVGTLVADAGKTITNVGLFDAATVGNLLVKADFTGIALNADDSIQFTLKLQLT